MKEGKAAPFCLLEAMVLRRNQGEGGGCSTFITALSKEGLALISCSFLEGGPPVL